MIMGVFLLQKLLFLTSLICSCRRLLFSRAACQSLRGEKIANLHFQVLLQGLSLGWTDVLLGYIKHYHEEGELYKKKLQPFLLFHFQGIVTKKSGISSWRVREVEVGTTFVP